MSVSDVTTPSLLTIPMEHYPGMSRFALDLVTGKGAASEFCRRMDPSRLAAPGSSRGASALVDGLEASNATWGNDVAEELGRWNDGKTITIVAGQQVGFAGGPLYTLAKIASLLKLRTLLAAEGVDATLFFWLATEDHDFAEVATLNLSEGARLETLRSAEIGHGRPIVGELPLPEDLRTKAITLFGTTRWLREGISFRDSFAELLSDTFKGNGIVFVDALLPELRARGVGLLERIVDSEAAIQAALATRAEELRAAGYPPQVSPAADGAYSLLYFVERNGQRAAIRRDGDRWRIGSRSLSHDEFRASLRREPWRISTAALMRPLLQDEVFGTDIFVGGPAEVSYYAQSGAVASQIGVRPPSLALRGHVLLARKRLLDVVEELQIGPAELFDAPEAIAARRASDAVNRSIETASEAEAGLLQRLAEFRATVSDVDGTVDRAIETSIRKIRYQFGRIRRRGIRAIARRDRERFAAIRRLTDAVDPGGTPQDRIVAWLPFWLQYGEALVPRMVDAIEPDAPHVVLIGL